MDRIRIDILPNGRVKLTKTAIVKAVERLINEKQFEVIIPPREFINYICENIKCSWELDRGNTCVTIHIPYTDPRLYPPVITEPRNMKAQGKFILKDNIIYTTRATIGWPLDAILADIFSRIDIFIKDNRERIDLFI